ncbi:MAG TPA: SDR family oxidoreductase [bacterium]|nr:SDR family oxidoreductase [bacterium]
MNQTALITGASGGIGADLASLAAQDGCNLVLVARSQDKLEQLAGELQQKHGIRALPFACDLANPESPRQVFDFCQKEHLSIDMLINNAGFGAYGAFTELPWETQRDEMQVNMCTLVALTWLFLPGMLERAAGKILNVASVAAFLPGPFFNIYYATKAFVLSFSEALSEETRGSGVTVTCLCPGPTKTDFFHRAKTTEFNSIFMPMHSSDQVARTGYAAMLRGRPLVVPGSANKLSTGLMRFVPRSLLRRISARINRI